MGPPIDVPNMWDSSVNKFGDGGMALGAVEISELAAFGAIFKVVWHYIGWNGQKTDSINSTKLNRLKFIFKLILYI